MRKLLSYSAIFAAFLSCGVQAGVTTYTLNATVTEIYDPANVLQGSINMNDPVSGTYEFELQVPDEDPNAEFAHYNQAGLAAGFNLQLGAELLKTDPSVPGHMHFIDINNSLSDFFIAVSWGNLPLSNGAVINDVVLDLYDGSGVALSHTQLSSTPPSITAFPDPIVYIGGTDASGANYFNIRARLNSLTGDGSPDTGNSQLVALQVEAVIKDIWDPSGALEGKLLIGDKLNGSYKYNKTLVDSEPAVDFGRYQHNPDGSGYGFDILGGNFNFKTNSYAVPMMVDLYNGQPNPDNYMVYAYGNNFPLSNGATVDDIGMYINDDSGTMLSSDQIADNPPSLTGSGFYDLFISGMHPNGMDYYSIVATITSINAEEVANIAPPSGKFIPGQQFDAAVILQPGTPSIIDYNAVIIRNGMYTDLPKCMYMPPNPEDYQFLLCPSYSMFLSPGDNEVKFFIVLQTGKLLEKTVHWRILQ